MKQEKATKKHAKIVCIGNELLNGSTVNTNASYFAKALTSNKYRVTSHTVVADNEQDIIKEIKLSLPFDLVIVNGGLGPTVDDKTREAVAKALSLELVYNTEIEQQIKNYLDRGGISLDANNKRQAFFPKGAIIIPNDNGTACGFKLHHNSCEIIVLPGPPKECLPMVDSLFGQSNSPNPNILSWRILGMTESKVSALIEQFFDNNKQNVEQGIFFRYPYVDLELEFEAPPEQTLINNLYAEFKNCAIITQHESASSLLVSYLQLNKNIAINVKQNVIGKVLDDNLAPYKPNGNISSHVINIQTSSNYSFFAEHKGVIEFSCQVNNQSFTINIPNLREDVVYFAYEFIAFCILRSLKQL